MSAAEVRIGQVWADNDDRVKGRTLRVAEVSTEHAVCVTVTNDTHTQSRIDRGDRTAQDRRGKSTRIKLSRFRPTSTGYRLAENQDVIR